ncbi:MAG TPA: ubiquinol oxidase subunit II [Luteibacter sp.]|uniref:ubiquinol oxidase subunit II n=1 Tax=Luteibacter sp. TaxID=1886636 RepID=UPI002C46617C|nr:ubiquinol oxidase subunit II [Luteibacter sp.]HVI54659.1 ubiquinol oxidase subunit II [Luteibacter sp.]
MFASLFHRFHRPAWRIAALCGVVLLQGCRLALFDPKGDIGVQERRLILVSLGLMLLVVVPVIGLTLYFFWRYRATNTKARYAPEWSHSTGIEIVVWTIPCVIVAVLAVLIWKSTHALDPYKALAAQRPPLKVDVVALNWKWLFIYPDYGVATVNELVVPARTPIEFHLTADSLMNSFFIPRLGSQVYAMAGMETRLHLVADDVGTFAGRSSAYSGPGFSGMRFDTFAVSDADFADWIGRTRRSSPALTMDGYHALTAPSEHEPPRKFGSVDAGLFERVVDQYMPAPPRGDVCGQAFSLMPSAKD